MGFVGSSSASFSRVEQHDELLSEAENKKSLQL